MLRLRFYLENTRLKDFRSESAYRSLPTPSWIPWSTLFRWTRNAIISPAEVQTTCIWVNLRKCERTHQTNDERALFWHRRDASWFGPAPYFTSFHLRALHLFSTSECTVLVITCHGCYIYCCCHCCYTLSLLIVLFASHPGFLSIVSVSRCISVYLRLSHVSFCARVNNIFFVSRLASCNPAPASHRLSISLRSLGTEVAPRLFPDSLVLGRFTRVLRGIIRRADQSDRIDSSRSANHRGHLTPEIGTWGRTIDYFAGRPWHRESLFSPEESEEWREWLKREGRGSGG